MKEECYKKFINEDKSTENINRFAQFCFNKLNNPELAIENWMQSNNIFEICEVIITQSDFKATYCI